MSVHIITSRSSSGGTIAPLGAQTVIDGQTEMFTITPATGYALSELYVDDVLTTNASSYSFTNNSANHTIASIFALTGGRYSSQSDLITHIGLKQLAGLTNDTPDATTPDPLVVADMIDHADRLIDSKVGETYNVPFIVSTNCDSVPPQINHLSTELAIWHCFLRRFTILGTPQTWKDVYANCIQELDDIAQELEFLDGNPTIKSKEAHMRAPREIFDFDDPNNPVSNF